MRLLTATLAVTLGLSASAALAQSYNAPAGIPAAVAPGGLEGRAADRNFHELVESRSPFLAPRGYRDDRDAISTGSLRARRGDRD